MPAKLSKSAHVAKHRALQVLTPHVPNHDNTPFTGTNLALVFVLPLNLQQRAESVRITATSHACVCLHLRLCFFIQYLTPRRFGSFHCGVSSPCTNTSCAPLLRRGFRCANRRTRR